MRMMSVTPTLRVSKRLLSTRSHIQNTVCFNCSVSVVGHFICPRLEIFRDIVYNMSQVLTKYFVYLCKNIYSSTF